MNKLKKLILNVVMARLMDVNNLMLLTTHIPVPQ